MAEPVRLTIILEYDEPLGDNKFDSRARVTTVTLPSPSGWKATEDSIPYTGEAKLGDRVVAYIPVAGSQELSPMSHLRVNIPVVGEVADEVHYE